jgi:hypothetical protein
MPYVPTSIDTEDTLATAREKLNTNFADIQDELELMVGEVINWIQTELTGGGEDALDGIDGDLLSDGMRALVIVGNNPADLYWYVVDEDAGLEENSPRVIVPDTNRGDKCWILAGRGRTLWEQEASPQATDDVLSGYRMGDSWLYDGEIWFCVDNAENNAVWRKVLSIGLTADEAAAGDHSHGEEYMAVEDHTKVLHDGMGIDAGTVDGHEATEFEQVANKGEASGYASLNAQSKVVQEPASKGQASGVASLNADSQVVQQPAAKAQASGIASLNAESLVVQQPAAKGQASGVASLNASTKVVEDPANATATPTASKIPIADASGTLNDWITKIDVVGGRLELNTTPNPDELIWKFYTSNQIVLHNGTDWTPVLVATEPSAAYNADDMGGDDLVASVVYDVFAKYSSATAFTLEFAKWGTSAAGSSTRYSAWATSTAYKIGQRVSQGGSYYACLIAHTSGTFSTDLAAGKWVAVTGAGDFLGLGVTDGRLVYANLGDWRKYRWLGVIYTYNNGGTVNFKDDEQYRYISNFYNSISKAVYGCYNYAGTWATTSTSYVEIGGANNFTKGMFVLCRSASTIIETSATSGCDILGKHAVTACAIDGTPTMGSRILTPGMSLNITATKAEHYQFGIGYHYIYMKGCTDAEATATWLCNEQSARTTTHVLC